MHSYFFENIVNVSELKELQPGIPIGYTSSLHNGYFNENVFFNLAGVLYIIIAASVLRYELKYGCRSSMPTSRFNIEVIEESTSNFDIPSHNREYFTTEI